MLLFHGLSAVDVSSCAGLSAVQGITVALPRAGAGRPSARWLWVAPPAVFAAAVLVLAWRPEVAEVLTGLAFVAVPALAGLALTRLARGSRPVWALAVPPLLGLSLAGPGRFAGQLAITTLCALSAVALGAALVRWAGARRLALGIAVLAAADVVLVADGRVQAAASALASANIGRLPELSHIALGTFTLGYGDLFVAGLAGAVAGRRPGGQLRVAALTAALMLLEGALFAGAGPYPATVPVAIALLLEELGWRLRGWRGDRAPVPGSTPGSASAAQRCIAA